MPHVSLDTVLARTRQVVRNTMDAKFVDLVMESLTVSTMARLLAQANALNIETAQRHYNRAGLNAHERRALRRSIIRCWQHALNTGRIIPILYAHAKTLHSHGL